MGKKKPKFTADDLEFALENAAAFLEAEEWPESDGGAQEAANKEAAKRIRAMVKRSVTRRAIMRSTTDSSAEKSKGNPWGLKLDN